MTGRVFSPHAHLNSVPIQFWVLWSHCSVPSKALFQSRPVVYSLPESVGHSNYLFTTVEEKQNARRANPPPGPLMTEILQTSLLHFSGTTEIPISGHSKTEDSSQDPPPPPTDSRTPHSIHFTKKNLYSLCLYWKKAWPEPQWDVTLYLKGTFLSVLVPHTLPQSGQLAFCHQVLVWGWLSPLISSDLYLNKPPKK
jgi:hypothetical protein